MGLFDRAALAAGRARYAAAQGLRSAWYGAQMRAAKSRTTGFYRPDDPEFSPTRGKPDMARGVGVDRNKSEELLEAARESLH